MSKLIRFSVLALMSLVLAVPMVAQASAFVDNFDYRYPMDFIGYNDCTGEYTEVSGELHTSGVIVANDNTYHASIEVNPQGMTALGLSSGSVYHGSGLTRSSLTDTSGPGYIFTFENRSRFNTSGPGNNYQLHETLHITFNANGVVTTVVDNFSFVCG
jgi:hypothetical protein